MPVYIQEFESEVTFTEDASSMSEEQLDSLVVKVLQRLEQVERDKENIREATQIRAEARPSAGLEH